MMSKVFNQFTTRSNVFGVWLTVGYFEVKNAPPYNEFSRPILGRELGAADIGGLRPGPWVADPAGEQNGGEQQDGER